MADRKQTPDILGEILGGESSPPPSTLKGTPEPEVKPKPAGRKPRRRTKPKQQKWEYREVVFRNYGGYRPRSINGVEQPGWKNAPIIHIYLNQLGEQGWELAGIGSMGNLEMLAYLKRLRQ